MAEENHGNNTNNNNNRQLVSPVVLPIEFRLMDIQRLVIPVSPHCIRLSEGVRNYELKTVCFNMLLGFHGLANKNPLIFIQDFYSIV